MDVLRVLVDNAGQVMTREDLITAVWGVEYGGDERLSRAISILRKALGDHRGQHNHIVTISRVGYRLIADVNPEGSETSVDIASPVPMSASRVSSVPKDLPEHSTPVSRPAGRPFKKLAAISVVFMACIFVGAFALQNRGESPELSMQARMEQGLSHIDNFTAPEAIPTAQKIFSDALSDNPKHAAARAGLAFAIFREYTHLERDPALLQRGKAHAEAALRQDEHLALANIAVAWAAEFEGDFERAHAHLDKADILNPDHTLALEGRFRSFAKAGALKEAEAVLTSAISVYPAKALFYSYLGDFYVKQDKAQKAEGLLKKSIALAPDNARTYAQLAHTLYQQNRTDEAVEAIQQGLAINETALLYNNLGTYLFFQGQYGLAASAFEKNLELSGDTHAYLYWANLGDAYRWSEDKGDKAATAYRRAIQLLQTELDRYPDNANLRSRAAMFNAKLGNLDEAQSYMDSFELTPDSPSIQLYRAVVTYEILSDRTKSLAYLEAALNANYPLIEILNDPELTRLRQDPAYHRLLAKTQID